ncbi:MAG: hypothetical protein HQ582_05900 [Planctomycetes bacterium]|nr:hypothetical protein [Planctomycetota bacterium]
MRTQITSVTAICILAALAHAEPAPQTAGRAVPKSVLEQLGLGDLVVMPTEDYPSDVPDSPAESPEAKLSKAPVAAPSPDKEVAEARRKRIVEATADVEAVGGEVETAREVVLKAESDLALAKQAVSQRTSDLTQARGDVETARASAEAVNQKVAKATQRAAALSAEGQEMALVFTAQNDLIASLGPVHKELRKVAEKFNDSDVAATEAGLARLLAGKQEENGKRKEVLIVKVREYEEAKQSLRAVQHEAEQKQKELTLAGSKWKDVNQRVLVVEREVEQKESDVALAESLVDKLTVAHRTAKDRLRAANVSTTTVTEE